MTGERAARMAELEEQVRTCPLCDLSKTRTHAVPGEGPIDAEIMFIGEGPGQREDQRGRPFIGPAGRLLDELLASIDLDRGKVYITNVVKCRPPGNRDPLPPEIEACAPYLRRQVALIRPKVVVTLGRHSMAKVFPGATIGRVHGQPKRIGDIFYFPMYHPAAALHQSALLDTLKADMKKLPALIEEARAFAARAKTHGGSEGDAVYATEEEAPTQLGLFD